MWNPGVYSPKENLSTDIGDPHLQASSELSQIDAQKAKLLGQYSLKWWKNETLIHALSAMNAPPSFVAVRCPSTARHRAGYSPSRHTVWVCGNLVHNPFEMRRLLAHELVHAFDFTRAEIDDNNIDHIACSEIRAWNLSGECDLWRNWFQFLGDDMIDRKQRCIKENALLSVREHKAFYASEGSTSPRTATTSLSASTTSASSPSLVPIAFPSPSSSIAPTKDSARDFVSDIVDTVKPPDMGTGASPHGQSCAVEHRTSKKTKNSLNDNSMLGNRLVLAQEIIDRRSAGKQEYKISESLFRQCFDDHWPFTAKAHLDTSWRPSAKLYKKEHR